ncbi:MAG: hypothetical protein ACRD3T_13615 [Terriglobia bacterium]
MNLGRHELIRAKVSVLKAVYRFAAAGFVLLAFLLLLPSARASEARSDRPSQPVPAATVRYRNTGPAVGYVGSKVCAECHSDIYQSFKATDMGRSMVMPDDASQSVLLLTPATVDDQKLNRQFQAFGQGNRVYQSESEIAPGRGEVFRNTKQVEYVIGAGENGFGYLVRRGQYLFEAPLSYYTKFHQWELSPGYQFADYGFNRPILVECLSCHSGRSRPVSGRDGMYLDPPFQELSIGCENCHGPGELHVGERRRGAPVRRNIDTSIVNPANLPPWLADNVCMACHETGDVRVQQLDKTALDFRPGTPLDRTIAIFSIPLTPATAAEKSPLIEHYSLMTLSKCYLSSGGKMSCLTCHDPHHEPTGAGAVSYYRAKCLNCHNEQICTLPLATRMKQVPADNCAGCHMPKQNLQTLAHSALTNHRIIARLDEPFPEVAFHQTSAALPDLVHLSAIPGETASPVSPAVLLRAYQSLKQTHPQYEKPYEATLDELAKAPNWDPVVLAALGRRLMQVRTAPALAEAAKDFKQAIAAGSTSAADYENLANLLANSGNTMEAISVLQHGITLNPYSSRLYKSLALRYVNVRQYAPALQTMKKDLDLFPEDSFMRGLIARAESVAPQSH